MSAALSALTFAFLISGINGVGHGHPAFVVVPNSPALRSSATLLIRRQARWRCRLLPVDLFQRPIFALSVTTSVCTFVAQGIAFVSLPFYFQDAIGASPVETGLLMTPWPVMVAIIAPIAGRLADRYPAGILGGIGLGDTEPSALFCSRFCPPQPGDADIVWRIVVCGFGFGFFQSPNNRAIISSAPRERSGGAGAIQATARLLGQTIGAALVALVFDYAGPSGGAGTTVSILVAAGFAALAALASLSRLLRFARMPRPARTADLIPPITAEGSKPLRFPR